MNNLIPVEFNNEIVITTKTLAEIYECDEKQISNNFKRNEDKFIERKHYYKLIGKELKEFKTNHLNDEPSMLRINCLYLWTKRGASRHCKMLGTEKAWDMFDSLEENYFNPKIPQLTRKQELQLKLFSKDSMDVVNAHNELIKLEIEEATKPLLNTIDEKDAVIDVAINNKGLFDIGLIGKMLKPYNSIFGARKIFSFLRDNKILIDKPGSQRHNIPFDKYNKYFEIKNIEIENEWNVKMYVKTYLNGKGVKWLLNKLAKEGFIKKSEINYIKENIERHNV